MPGDSETPAKAQPEAAPAPQGRQLPSPEEIGAWVAGAELPTLAHLFDQLNTLRFDALTMQIRKEELLPQHWQVISRRELPADLVFEELAVVKRLRSESASAEVAERRLAALEVAWRQLGGKAPALWTVADLIAVLRRIIDQELEVDLHDLLSVTRDVWAGLSLPHGRAQLELLWAILVFVRQKTKK